jgi:hypothetical protein
VGEFNQALNRSTTPNDASDTQSSKGTEHSQDTSKSLPFVLATRPPTNFGSPTVKQGAPLHDTQGKGTKAGSETGASEPQIKERRLEGKLSDGPNKAQDGTNAEKPSDTTLQTVLTIPE